MVKQMIQRIQFFWKICKLSKICWLCSQEILCFSQPTGGSWSNLHLLEQRSYCPQGCWAAWDWHALEKVHGNNCNRLDCGFESLAFLFGMVFVLLDQVSTHHVLNDWFFWSIDFDEELENESPSYSSIIPSMSVHAVALFRGLLLQRGYRCLHALERNFLCSATCWGPQTKPTHLVPTLVGGQDLVSDGLRCSPFAQPGGGW